MWVGDDRAHLMKHPTERKFPRMDTDTIYATLTPIFRDVLDNDTLDIHPGLTAKDVGEWDSLSHVRLILSVEKSFGIHFSTAELSQFENVGQLADMIANKTAAIDPA